jgi:hypothetical protein
MKITITSRKDKNMNDKITSDQKVEKRSHESSWSKRLSSEQIFEHVANDKLVKILAEIDIEEASTFILKELKKIQTWNVNEYYSNDIPTCAYVGVHLKAQPCLVVDSDKNRLKECAVVLCEMQLKESSPRNHIKYKLKRCIQKFLSVHSENVSPSVG